MFRRDEERVDNVTEVSTHAETPIDPFPRLI